MMPKQKYNYWINTVGKQAILMTLKEGNFPSSGFRLMYSMVECNGFVYWLFKKTKINLKAKDKFAWRRN